VGNNKRPYGCSFERYLDIEVSIAEFAVSKSFAPGTNANAISFGISAKFIGSTPKNTNPERPISSPKSRSKAS